jgi:PTH1 family peptidyl-tRNA hydrolase
LKFIVGIGNPGREYEKTRHNVGFRVVDALKKNDFKKARLLKPSTFVNRTGLAVLELKDRHRIAPEDVLVVCDDVYLPLGTLRLRAKGSAGGHNGLKSVIESLGTEEFPRLRVGVGKEKLPKDLAGFVLEPFSKEEETVLKEVLKKAVLACEDWATLGFQDAQNRLGSTKSKREGVSE